MTRNSFAALAQWCARVTGGTQLLLGTAIWTGRAESVIPIHVSVGLVLLLSLWTLTGLAVGQVAAWRVALAGFWGLLMVTLGLSQDSLLPGSLHWLIQVVHLGVGLAAVAQAETLAHGIRGRARAIERTGQPARP